MFAHFAKNTLFLSSQENTPPPPMKSWPELGTLSFEWSRIPHPLPQIEKLARTWHLVLNSLECPLPPQ